MRNYFDFFEHTRMAPDGDFFLRREGRGKWATEWSFGVTQYAQKARYKIFDGADVATVRYNLYELSFSLLRDISMHWIERANPSAPLVKTHLGVTIAPAFGKGSVHATGSGFDGNYINSHLPYWTSSIFVGLGLAHTVELSPGLRAHSMLSYRIDPTAVVDMGWQYPAQPLQRLSWKVGMSYKL